MREIEVVKERKRRNDVLNNKVELDGIMKVEKEDEEIVEEEKRGEIKMRIERIEELGKKEKKKIEGMVEKSIVEMIEMIDVDEDKRKIWIMVMMGKKRKNNGIEIVKVR